MVVFGRKLGVFSRKLGVFGQNVGVFGRMFGVFGRTLGEATPSLYLFSQIFGKIKQY